MENRENPILEICNLFDEILQWGNMQLSKYLHKAYKTEVSGEEIIKVEIALPGFKKTDIKIRMEGNVLNVSYMTPENEKSKADLENPWKRSFEKKFRLGSDLDSSKITASMEDGILTIIIPYVKNKKDINIS